MQRRQFLGAGMAAFAYAASGFVPAWAQNAPQFGTPTLPDPGFRRLRVGDAEVVALIDGIARRPLAEEFVRNAPLSEVKALLASQGLSTDHVDVPFTPFLVVSGGRRVLIDTGLGEFGGPTTGKLLANLAAAGVQPGDIDTVLISHYHGDHINGLRRRDGSLVFANAKIMVPAPEHAFWMDEARLAKATGGLKGAMENARRVFAGLPADRVVRFEPGAEVVPGVRSIAAYGHTPGMTMFELASAGQSFTYIADLTNIPALFARNPDFAVGFDMDPEMARKTRRAVFARLAASGATMGGFHFPFPAFGRMTAAGAGYVFEPIES